MSAVVQFRLYLPPGTYCDTLEPGIYLFKGTKISLGGTGSLIGTAASRSASSKTMKGALNAAAESQTLRKNPLNCVVVGSGKGLTSIR